MSSSATASMAILLLVVSISGSEAEVGDRDSYCKIDPRHTLCVHMGSISEDCGEVLVRGLGPDEKALVTRLHNERRAFIANGLEKRGDPGPQPPAANMMQLTWDDELALEAQTWTDQCVSDHDCPTCRTLPRFKVGQNLFWFGHFTGSWEKSVKGWYDEVADFNSTFIDPFYVIPGVLVGHYTQMTWSQTSKIGCGKLYSQPRNSRYGQQFFICNYGLAGNLIKSQMYKVGPACSSCPSGTSCSSEYPGLCQGQPDQPLTVRPPVYTDLGTFPTRPRPRPRPNEKPSSGFPGSSDPDTVHLPELVVHPPKANDNSPEECVYSCRPKGGCSVEFSTSRLYSGSVIGSCFPDTFGGECSGTPKTCKECKGVCRGSAGKKITVKLTKDGSPGEMTSGQLTSSSSSSSSPSTATTCTYSCQASGGCSVRINSAAPVNGSVVGSCFSQVFGGSCSGTPAGCKDCSKVCGSREEKEVTLPADL